MLLVRPTPLSGMKTKLLLAGALLLCSSVAGWQGNAKTSDDSQDDDIQQSSGSSHDTCGPSAPEKIASEFLGLCDSTYMYYFRINRYAAHCSAAMHRFCNEMFNTPPGTMIGVMREQERSVLGISCIRTSYSGQFYHIPGYPEYAEGERRRYCLDGENTQRMGCTHAIKEFCWMKFGQYKAAGYMPEWQEYSCIPTVAMEWVPSHVMRTYNEYCYGTSWPQQAERADCYSAAAGFCADHYPGSDGGIPQGNAYIGGSSSLSMLVACYKAEYVGYFFGIRNQRYYDLRSIGNQVCNFQFQIDKAQILNAAPQLIKMETYDNRHSSVIMRREFSFSKSETVVTKFTYQNSIAIGAEVKVNVKLPFLAEKEVKLSATVTQGISFTKETSTTKTWTSTSIVEVPPGKGIRKEARITITQMSVPFTAQVRTGLGSVRDIEGVWNGVDVSDVEIRQYDI